MSAGCVRLVLGRLTSGSCTPAWRFAVCTERTNIITSSWRWSPFCTAQDTPDPTPPAPEEEEKKKKKKLDTRPPTSISSVGRLIAHKEIQVISSTGEDMGTMHRTAALQIMQEQGLKLVLLRENTDPPVYQLMSGKQIHEEQLRIREKQKNKAVPVQVKELTFNAGIAPRDVGTKLKQVESFLEKKHQVKITLRAARGKAPEDLHLLLEQMVQQLEVAVGFVSKPMLIRDGKAAMCILRPPSAKELSQKKKTTAPSPPPSSDSSSDSSSSSSSSDSKEEETQRKEDTDSTEGTLQA